MAVAVPQNVNGIHFASASCSSLIILSKLSLFWQRYSHSSRYCRCASSRFCSRYVSSAWEAMEGCKTRHMGSATWILNCEK